MKDRIFRATLLGFPDPGLESAFLRTHHRRAEFRGIFIISGAILALYGILELTLINRGAGLLVMARIGLNLAIFSALLAATYHPRFERMSGALLVAMALSAAWSASVLELAGRGSAYGPMYLYGVALVLIGFFGLGKLPVLHSFLAGLAMILPAIAVDAFGVESDPYRALSKAAFLATITIVGSLSTGLIQFAARRSFISHREMEQYCVSDNLTGLHNRRYFLGVVQPELQRFARRIVRNGQPLSRRATDEADGTCHYLVLIDVDGFSRLNETYGYEAGDAVLAEIGIRLRALIRSSDVAVRWGGEEFLLVLKNTTEAHARRFPALLRNALITSPMRIGSREVPITLSCGGVCIPRGNSDASDAVDHYLAKAQHALVHSKTAGRDRFTDFHELEEGPFGQRYREIV